MLHDKRILIVEDDAHNLAIMSAILRRSGAKVFFERWGEEILDRVIKALPLDLVLLDLNLPTTDGYSVYEVIRAIPEMDAVPVVVVSAHGDAAVINKVREMGLNGFIAKPINSRTFAQYVADAIAGKEVWVRT